MVADSMNDYHVTIALEASYLLWINPCSMGNKAQADGTNHHQQTLHSKWWNQPFVKSFAYMISWNPKQSKQWVDAIMVAILKTGWVILWLVRSYVRVSRAKIWTKNQSRVYPLSHNAKNVASQRGDLEPNFHRSLAHFRISSVQGLLAGRGSGATV